MARTASDDSVFHAIASPTRRALLDQLSYGESKVSELVDALDVTQSAVSQQLAILESAGLVLQRSEGRFRYYRVVPEPLVEVQEWVDRYRMLMERQLDALGRVLDDMDTDKPKRKKRR